MGPRRRVAGLCAATAFALLVPSVESAAAAPANDNFADAQVLTGESASATGTNVDATTEPGEPEHGVGGGASVWYAWTAPATAAVRVQTCGSDFDTALAVYTGSAVNALSRVASNDDACNEASRVTFDATAGVTYVIAVDGAGGEQGSITLTLGPPPTPALGQYSGRTEFPDSKPISFRLLAGLATLRNLTVSFALDCEQHRFPVGELRFKKLVFKTVAVAADATFAAKATIKFRGGGSLVVTVKGRFKPPLRATGTLNARASLPGGVRCRNFFGTVSWTARHR